MKLYPPCDTEEFLVLNGVNQKDTQQLDSYLSAQDDQIRNIEKQLKTCIGLKTAARVVLSVGQFRPEKDHSLQLSALKCLRDLSIQRYDDVVLVMLGSVRNEDDQMLVDSLRQKAATLGIEHRVVFATNTPFVQMKQWMMRASVGLHTMWNEHFGISVVEMMAAGLAVVAHNTAGPKMDIVVDIDGEPTGYLAASADEYAECIAHAMDNLAAAREKLSSVSARTRRATSPQKNSITNPSDSCSEGKLSDRDMVAMVSRARAASQRFSEKVFVEAVGAELGNMLA